MLRNSLEYLFREAFFKDLTDERCCRGQGVGCSHSLLLPGHSAPTTYGDALLAGRPLQAETLLKKCFYKPHWNKYFPENFLSKAQRNLR